jgi:hypothetical protein
MVRLPTRQVHLDFHTSELIPGIGTRFSKPDFQKALVYGHVNSITVFAKCHHGWHYYPTQVGAIHPGLDFDLTGALVDAAHEIGVRAPIYLTAGWSAKDAREHPAWKERGRDGTARTMNVDPAARPEDPRPIGSWENLCLVSGYQDLLFATTREVCERYPVVDGLFYDICFLNDDCFCEACLAGMRSRGLDPDRPDDARAYYILRRQSFMAECGRILHERHPDATIFFNGGAEIHNPQFHAGQSHFEMEDLPTTWGGYDKMPARAKFFARSGKDFLGMTGKFHTMWGEFGGFKHPDALRYECAAMMMYGARCSVGDQLHPCGEMDAETYRTIGEAYRYVERIERYCTDVGETSRLGVLFSGKAASDEGLVRMLLERQMDFDIVLPADDLARFDALVLPDEVLLDEPTAARLTRFVEGGGALLLTGDSGLDATKERFLVDIGAENVGEPLFANDYAQVGPDLVEGIVRSPFLFYEGARRTRVTDGVVLAAVKEPYFDRTYGHYCSHQNAPNRLEDAAYPAAVQKGRVVYLAHKVCALYFAHGARYHRDYFHNALKLVYRDPVLSVSMPSGARARLGYQAADHRYVLHLLYGLPVARGRVSVIEDLPELRDVAVSAKVDGTVRKVYRVPCLEEIPFTQSGDRVRFVVPSVACHQAVVLDVG